MADDTTVAATAPEAPAAPTTTPPAAEPATQPAPAAAPATQPAPIEQQVGMNDTIEYTDKSGKQVETTVQELTDAQATLAKLGDLDGLADMAGFLKGDPDAQKRVLQAQMDQLAPAPPEDPQAEYVKQLEERLAGFEGRLKPMERLVTQAEASEDRTYVEALLAVDQVKEKFPVLSLKPDVALKLLQPQYTKLRQLAASKGVDLSQRNDLVIQLVQRVESDIKSLFQAYDFQIPQSAPAADATQVNGQPQAAQVPPIVPQIPVLMPQVPQAGGVMGAPATGANQPQQAGVAGFSRMDMLAKLKANRAVQGQ